MLLFSTFAQVSMLYSSSVVCDLLQSCYTGFLQFSSEEIVSYLTAASYFQMEHIVELCRGALEKYVQLKSRSSQKVSRQVAEKLELLPSDTEGFLSACLCR